MLSVSACRFDSTTSNSVFDTNVEVNRLDTRPKNSVVANPRMGPVPNWNRNAAPISADRWVSTSVRNTRVNPAFPRNAIVASAGWEALSPEPFLADTEEDYRWLSQVYESVKPPSGNGRLLWHVLGAKTLDLIHENIHVDAVRDDLDTLVMDADFLEGLLAGNDPEKAKEIEFQVSARIRRH